MDSTDWVYKIHTFNLHCYSKIDGQIKYGFFVIFINSEHEFYEKPLTGVISLIFCAAY